MDKKIKVAINGLGRIGRAFLKLASTDPRLEIVAVNDLADLDNLIYLLKYDSAYGRFAGEVERVGGDLHLAGQTIKFFQEKDPSLLAWGELGVMVVVEATGVFETYAKAQAHLTAGATKVVITAPVKDDPADAGVAGGTVLLGINEETLPGKKITSNGSCTTNCVAPVIKILSETVGVESALLNTIHAYTATQKLVDVADAKDWRRGRAGAVNLIPSTTGAAVAVGQVLSAVAGKFDGIAVRVPVISGSLVDLTFIAKRETSVEEINQLLEQASKEAGWQKIFTVTREPVVSSDILGNPYASIADLSYTKVIGRLVKVLVWYDNELGYTHTLIEHVVKSGQAS